MKALLKFLVIVAVVVLLSAIAAPLLFKFLPFKFERIFNRCIMIGTLTAIVVAVKMNLLKFPSDTLRWKKESGRLFATAFLAGLLTLVLLTAFKMSIGLVQWSLADKGIGGWIWAVIMSTGAALIIGFIEECFFRGFFFTTLRERFSWTLAPALVFTNVFYAIIHFVQGKKPFIGPNPTFFDSLKLLKAPFMSLADWQSIWPGAVGLFIFGCILTFLFLRTRSLYSCMGLHAGCVFFLKMDGAFTFHESADTLIYGGSKGYDGVLGWAFLMVMGLLLWRILKPRSRAIGFSVLLLVFSLSIPGTARLYAQESWSTFEEDRDEKSAADLREDRRSYDMPASSPLSPPEFTDAQDTTASESIVRKTKSSGRDESGKKASGQLPPGENFRTPAKSLETGQGSLGPQTPVSGEVARKESGMPQTSTPAREISGPETKAQLPASEAVSKPGQEITGPSAGEGAVQERGVGRQSLEEGVSQSAKKPPLQNGDFSFLAALPFSRAETLEYGRVISQGEWRGDAMVFPGHKDLAPVLQQEVEIGGVERPSIYLQPLSGYIRRLSFTEVPPAAKLTVNYGVSDTQLDKEKVAAVYLKVLVGEHVLARLRILNEGGWKTQTFDLGPAAFLKHPIVITFEITADELPGRYLAFDAFVA